MKIFKIVLLIIIFLLIACSQQQPRRPITISSGSFMKESIARNKKLNNTEESIIDSVIKSNPDKTYIASKKGYWYYYETKNSTDTISPKRGDIANFDYSVQDVYGNIIYTQQDLQSQTYRVDKENIMTGLREAIKIMHRQEKVIFLFPSHLAYGYFGDKNKIGTNTPLICTVELKNFYKEIPKKIIKKPETDATITPEQIEVPKPEIKQE